MKEIRGQRKRILELDLEISKMAISLRDFKMINDSAKADIKSLDAERDDEESRVSRPSTHLTPSTPSIISTMTKTESALETTNADSAISDSAIVKSVASEFDISTSKEYFEPSAFSAPSEPFEHLKSSQYAKSLEPVENLESSKSPNQINSPQPSNLSKSIEPEHPINEPQNEISNISSLSIGLNSPQDRFFSDSELTFYFKSNKRAMRHENLDIKSLFTEKSSD